MENLFARHKPKRGMVGLMLAGSLMLHGGLVGVATLWTPPQPKEQSVVLDIDPIPEGPEIITDTKILQPNLPETPAATATPEAVDLPVVAPLPSPEDPIFAEPAEATPPLHRTTAAKPSASSNRPTSTQAAARTSTGPSGDGMPGGGSSVGLAGNWFIPHPPYPHVRGLLSGVGQTTVRVTTDAAGRVSNVVIVKSTGNPVLDSHTLSYVRNNWHGPANASRTTEFVYELR